MCTHVTCGFMMSLGCYGDVLRVKILYNKKDSALIQFAESFQAQTGWCSDACSQYNYYVSDYIYICST